MKYPSRSAELVAEAIGRLGSATPREILDDLEARGERLYANERIRGRRTKLRDLLGRMERRGEVRWSYNPPRPGGWGQAVTERAYRLPDTEVVV